MRAHAGDVLVLAGTHAGDGGRAGMIVEARGDDGAPPYLVRWFDDDHVSLVFPGPDSRIEIPHSPRARPRRTPTGTR